MQYQFGYGKHTKTFQVDDANLLMEIRQNEISIESTGAEEVRRALHNPIGAPRLNALVKPGEKIVIITSDITRPLPSYQVLPEVISELEAGGVDRRDITVVFALGSHRSHTEKEMRYLVGDAVYDTVRCIDSNTEDYVYLGTTALGTPVEIFREVAEAQRRICLGNIEYHYFAGYSGGAKAIMPGVSTRAAIQSNHSAMVRDEARAGALDGNPVREDIDSVVDFVPIDFIVNVVLDEKKKIIKAVAGHYKEAHREGCKFLDGLYKVPIPQLADIVIATPGGYPKDINLYQAQKALDNAKHAVREGGIVILAAACTEGLGEEVFERWMLSAASTDGLIQDIQARFELGGHKAAAIALVAKKADIFLVSDMDDSFVRSLFMHPYHEITDALDAAYEKLGKNAKVLLMPYGGSTLPVL